MFLIRFHSPRDKIFMIRLIYNRYPLIHAVVHSVQDILECILFARKFNLHVTVKSSGHDMFGRCSAHGSFTINLMEMKYMKVTETTENSEFGELKVETGVTWREMYHEVSL